MRVQCLARWKRRTPFARFWPNFAFALMAGILSKWRRYSPRTERGTPPFGKVTGREAISDSRRGAAARRAAQPESRDIHLMSNIIIALDGERANVRSNWIVVQNSAQGPQIRGGGVSIDEMVKQDGKWLFRSRKTDRFMPP